MTPVQEHALGFECEGEVLAGIVHEPVEPTSDLGLLVIVGGPQYRAGSHRQFVLLCRAAAAAGHAAMRFDMRGMGDSSGDLHDFEHVTTDIGAAIEAFQRQVPTVKRIALWGLCDGASAALLYLDDTADPRVRGLCLLNPWVRSPQSFAKTQVRHYYASRLVEPAFWAKLLSGKVGMAAWRGFMASVRARSVKPAPDDARYQQRMARAWSQFAGPVLMVLSGNDLTAKEFVDATRVDPIWRSSLARAMTARHDLQEADHTFSTAAWREHVETLTVQWANALATGPSATPAASSRSRARPIDA